MIFLNCLYSSSQVLLKLSQSVRGPFVTLYIRIGVKLSNSLAILHIYLPLLIAGWRNNYNKLFERQCYSISNNYYCKIHDP